MIRFIGTGTRATGTGPPGPGHRDRAHASKQTGVGTGTGPPGHRATKTRPGQDRRQTGTGTGPPGHGKKKGRGTAPGHRDRAPGPGHRDRATGPGTGPPGPGHTSPDQTKINLYPVTTPILPELPTQGPDIDPCIYDASDIGEGGNCKIVALFGSAQHGHLLSGLSPGENLQAGVWQHLAGLDLQAHAFCCKPEMSAVKLGLNRCLATEKQSLQDSLQSTIPWSFVVWLHAPQRAGCV